MTTKLKIAPLAAALAAVLLVSAPAFGQPSTRADGARVERPQRGMGPLVGAWRMTSLEVGTEGNLQRVPYSGQIIFTRSGTMSVQAMNPDANAPETPYTLNGYEAFYGTVAVDTAARGTGRHRARGKFDVTVESSVVRDLIGQRLTRVFKVSRNKLVLTPTDPAEGWRVTYERF
jgi:hypothetical protein